MVPPKDQPQLGNALEAEAAIGGATAAPERRPSGRVPQLDGVRGLAIALVVLCHYGAHGMRSTPRTPANWLHNLLNFGWTGVDLFFVLSGFLIGGILLENRTSPDFFKTFYARRVCRIFPLYYLWLLVSAGLLLLTLPPHIHQLFKPDLPFWSYFTYTQNILVLPLADFGPEWFGPTWSLAVEEQFYLLFPMLVRFCPPRTLPFWLVVLALSAVLLRVIAYFLLPAPGFTGFVLLPCRWDSLLLGALAAWWVQQPGFVEALRRHEWFLFALGGLILGTLVVLRLGHQADLRSMGTHLLGLFLLAVFYCEVLLLAVFSTRSWIRRFFCNPGLRWLGTVSYCVYLIHQPVSYLCHALFWQREPNLMAFPRFMTGVLALAITLGVAALSWRYYESRCVAWGRRRFAY